MSLKSQIEQEIKQAMLQKQRDRLRALRAIKSAILLAETEKGAGHVLDEATEIKLLQKAAKQRKDSLEVYQQQGRNDLAQVEQDELVVIEEFLPKQMSEQEVEGKVSQIIQDVQATGPKDMGKVMGAATKALGGQADGKLISQIARKLLGN